MAVDDATPIIIGVGDFKDKTPDLEKAEDPSALMYKAIKLAFDDTGLSQQAQKAHLIAAIDGISCVPPWTWNYADLPGVLAGHIGIEKPAYTHISDHGGNQPGYQLDTAARRVSQGQSKVVIVTGGEALHTVTQLAKAKKFPPKHWPAKDPNAWDVAMADWKMGKVNPGTKHDIGMATQVYSLMENAFRAHRKQSVRDNLAESAKLYEEFDAIAVQNECAWNYGRAPMSASDIGTISKKNRAITFPYPMLQCAFNTINLAGAIIITTVGQAKAMGVPQDKWVYILGGAGTDDPHDFWERDNLYSSKCLKTTLETALKVSSVTVDEVDCFDFYSCFPIVPKLACHYLGLPILGGTKPITLLGGLTSFGGAGNNYSMHALTAMTRVIRAGKYQTGLVLANGGYATHEEAIILSSKPHKNGQTYPKSRPLPECLEGFDHSMIALNQVEGPAVIEAYSVDFDRKGNPGLAFVMGRMVESGKRFVANHGDEKTLAFLASGKGEPTGMEGVVKKGDKDRNLFSLHQTAML